MFVKFITTPVFIASHFLIAYFKIKLIEWSVKKYILYLKFNISGVANYLFKTSLRIGLVVDI